MKKLFFVLLIILTLLFVTAFTLAFIYRNTALRYAVQKTVSMQLPGVEFSIGTAELNFPNQLLFTQIDLKDQSRVAGITLNRMELEFHPSKVVEYIRTGTAKGVLKQFFINGKKIQYRDIHVTNLQLDGRLDDGAGIADRYTGFLTSKEFIYKKIKMSEIKTEFELNGRTLLVAIYHLQFAGGMVTGTLEIDVRDDGLEYTAYVDMQNIKAGNLMIIFNLDKKLRMTGIWDGSIRVRGSTGRGITSVDGKLVADAKGGELVITDQAMISNIASRVGIAKDEVARSLSHHDYKEGTMELGVDDNAVKLNLSLSGDTGERNFDIYLHDFLK